nr:replication factor C subunit 2 [Tanacetum cinerariifolium]
MVKGFIAFILKLPELYGIIGGSVPLLSPGFTYKGERLGVDHNDPSVKDLLASMQNQPEVIPHEVVQALLAACKSGSFDSANKEVNNVIAEGYLVSQMLSQLFDMVIESEDMTDEQKAIIFKKLGEPDKVSDILIYFYFAFLWVQALCLPGDVRNDICLGFYDGRVHG